MQPDPVEPRSPDGPIPTSRNTSGTGKPPATGWKRGSYPPTADLAELRADLHLLLDAFRDGRPVVATTAHRRAYERLRAFAGLDRPEVIPTFERPSWWKRWTA